MSFDCKTSYRMRLHSSWVLTTVVVEDLGTTTWHFSVTLLHQDRTNILFAQVSGRKKFILCPATDLPRMHNDFGCYSPYSFSDPDRPVPKGVVRYECNLDEGHALFLPAGWWHEVVSLTPSVSLTYHNFDIDIPEVSWSGAYWIRNCPSFSSETSNH